MFKDIYEKDVNAEYTLLPVKERCGVTDPYVREYGELAGTMREYDQSDTCACVKDPSEYLLWSHGHLTHKSP